jgi:hypothetical protein
VFTAETLWFAGRLVPNRDGNKKLALFVGGMASSFFLLFLRGVTSVRVGIVERKEDAFSSRAG